MTRNFDDIVEGPLLGQLLRLSWPISLAMILQTGHNLIDIFWVARLNPESIAAVSLAGNVFFIILALSQMLGVGTLAMMARFFSRKEHDKVRHVFVQGILLALTVALLTLIAGVALSHHIIRLLGGTGTIHQLGTIYLRIIFVGFFFLLLANAINFSFRAVGDMKLLMRIMLTTVAVNMILDPLLILGVGFFPRLEVAGAAWATTIAKFAGFLYACISIAGDRSPVKIGWNRNVRPDSATMKLILLIGVPVGISFCIMAFNNMLLFRLVAEIDDYALAALGIGVRIIQLASLPVVGIGVAATTIVGQSLGAGKVRRAHLCGVSGASLGAGITILFGVIFFVFSGRLIALFSSQEDVIAYGGVLLKFLAVAQILGGQSIVMMGVFRGAGETSVLVLAGMMRLLALYALAVVLSRNPAMGIYGIWFAIPLAAVVEAALLWAFFAKGQWKKKKIDITLPTGL